MKLVEQPCNYPKVLLRNVNLGGGRPARAKPSIKARSPWRH